MRVHKLAVMVLLLATAVLMSSDPPPASQPVEKVLLLTDNSAGSVLHSMVHTCLEVQNDNDFAFDVSPAHFADAIASADWDRILVVMKHGIEPEFAQDLRIWASEHPERMVHMTHWAVEASAEIGGEDVVLATTSMTIWQDHTTIQTYALSKSDDALETTITPGLIWPTFEGVSLEAPQFIGTFSNEPPSCMGGGIFPMGLIALATPSGSPCRLEALQEYILGMFNCDEARNINDDLCDELYMPRPVPDSINANLSPVPIQNSNANGNANANANSNSNSGYTGDPVKWQKCRADSNKTHSECQAGKLRLYQLRIEKCKRLEEGNGGG